MVYYTQRLCVNLLLEWVIPGGSRFLSALSTWRMIEIVSNACSTKKGVFNSSITLTIPNPISLLINEQRNKNLSTLSDRRTKWTSCWSWQMFRIMTRICRMRCPSRSASPLMKPSFDLTLSLFIPSNGFKSSQVNFSSQYSTSSKLEFSFHRA